jgi:uncharacterized protein (DUF1499 family)
MITLLKWIVYLVVGGAAALLLAGQFGLLRGMPPDDLGVKDGKLKRPSKTPNSVTSQADLWPDHPMQAYARIAPLPLKGDGPATIARLAELCKGLPGAIVVTHKPDYLYVQFETKLMKFVDDAEFWYDPKTGVVQVRSASRVGRKDFDVNRSRVEALRSRLAAS